MLLVFNAFANFYALFRVAEQDEDTPSPRRAPRTTLTEDAPEIDEPVETYRSRLTQPGGPASSIEILLSAANQACL